MDADQFDRLTRAIGIGIGIGAPRRSVLAALASLLPLSVLERSSWAKKQRKRKKKKKKKKKRKKNRTETTCTVTNLAGGGAAHATQMSFKGKTLRLEQSEQPFGPNGAVASQMTLTLDGTPLLIFDVALQGGTSTTTLTYGDAFAGIATATFTNDGTTIHGSVDGRAIEPMPAGTDPNSVRFTDGGAPPEIQVDPDLVKAIREILQRATEGTAACQTARAHSAPARARRRRGRGVGAEDVDPTIQPDCLLLLAGCQTGWIGCQYGVALGCVSATIAYGVCFGIGSFSCLVAQETCRRAARHNPPCCPVRCGGDPVLSLWGEDPSCCVRGETCLDADSNRSDCCIEGTRPCHRRSCCFDDQDCEDDGICCARGYSSCGGVCCPDGSCLEGSCCAPPSGVACGGTCCPPFTLSCCNGVCCDGTCVDNRICCRAPNVACGNTCCAPGKCCNGFCCGNDESCQNNQCVRVCNPELHETCPNEPGYATCCPKGTICCRNGECCPQFAPVCCGDTCCFANEQCCPDNVCRTNCLH